MYNQFEDFFSEPLKATAESTMIFLEQKGTWKNA